jgi:nucleotide-binding universal stress UspA family protein
MPHFKRIVFATDFSEASALALPYANDLAQRYGATLHLLHVVQDPLSQPWSAEAYVMNIGDLVQEWTRAANAELSRVATTCSGTPVISCRVGRPAHEILAYAKEIGADLLVLGSHGHGALAQMMLGSVAERVVRHASCPVMTVRQPHATAETSRTATSAQASR